MAHRKEPKTFTLKGKDWPLTAEDGAQILMDAEALKTNQPFLKAAMAVLKEKKKLIEKATP